MQRTHQHAAFAIHLLAILMVLSTAAFAKDDPGQRPFVWIEGESPAEANFEYGTGGWGNAHYLSEGDWLHFSIGRDAVEDAVPAEGNRIVYRFDIESPGMHEVWARVGFEFIRAPFDWRIDDGPWQRIEPRENLTVDLMEIARWCEIAWLELGEGELASGRHTLEFRFPLLYEDPETRSRPKRQIFTCDAICIANGRFWPNGPHRPDASWQDDDDRAAAEKVYRLEASRLTEGDGEAQLALGGLWQIARWDQRGLVDDRTGPMEAPPSDAQLHWSAIEVPGDRNTLRPDLAYCHRYFYRTRVWIPPTAEGKVVLLKFGRTNLMATVFVNGKRVAFHDVAATGFTADCSEAIRPGEVNEIRVGIKDAYYALSGEGGENARFGFNFPLDDMNRNQGITMRMDYPVKGMLENGLLDDVVLEVTGRVYIDDLYVIPRVASETLEAEVTVNNSGNTPTKATVAVHVTDPGDRGEARLALPSQTVDLPAGASRTVRLSGPAQGLEKWWPDSPTLYEAKAVVTADGMKDRHNVAFGYREWGIDGTRFVLNGVPWQFRANLDHYGLSDGDEDSAEEAVDHWQDTGQNMFRLRFQKTWGGMNQREMLDFFDRHGVPVRRNVGTFDGQHASYRLALNEKVDGENVKTSNAALFENHRRQASRRVIEERNHPSIFVWELDNEIIYINARNFGNLDVAEPEFERTADLVRQLDQQGRGVMVAGGRALMEQSLPVNGCHYEESPLRDYPDMAYGLGAVGEAEAWTAQSDHQPWPMAMDRPIFLGETYFSPGWRPSKFAAVGGERCFLGRADTREANGLIAKMFSEGYRWQELAAFHYWFGNYGSAHYHSWQPVIALCRQWNWTFAAEQDVTRTIMVRNDTRRDDPIDFEWTLRVDGQEVASGGQQLQIAPGHGKTLEIRFKTPPVAGARSEGQLRLACRRDGEEVWHEVKDVSVLGRAEEEFPSLEARQLVVFDPEGKVASYLEGRVPMVNVDDIGAMLDNPADMAGRLLLVGPDALNSAQSTDPRWRRLVENGARLLVLDQTYPLHYQAVPADFKVTDFVGRVAFAENLEHPVFAGLTQKDFFTWSGDHVVYRNVYQKATAGARSLLQCDEDLSCSAMAECAPGEGLMLLCQAVVGSKLSSDPVAQRLLANLLRYAAEYRRIENDTVVVLPDEDPRRAMLVRSGLQMAAQTDLARAIESRDFDIVIADGGEDNLRRLAGSRDALEAFTQRGGWVMLWNVTPKGLPFLNDLVGVEHVMRPFRCEKVQLPAQRDPLTMGLSQRDVVFYSGERIFGWVRDEYLADDVFTHVVDLHDIAPFSQGPGIEGTASVVNGLTSDDAWKYIVYREGIDEGDPSMLWTFPRRERVKGFSIIPNEHYRRIERFRLVFDENPATAKEFALDDADGRHDFTFEPIEAETFRLEPLSYTVVQDRPVTGVDNLWIWVQRGEEFDEKVRPLLNIGALVKYPMGRGGVILNQLDIHAQEVKPENAEKKQAIVSTMLRNLDAVFSGERREDGSDALRYEPISLENHCNLYLTSERGWPDSTQDLARVPLDRQTLAGVEFEIRDFKTSPLESAITLQGMPGQRDLPRAVSDIQVRTKAEALVFLHTFYQRRAWQPRLRDGVPTEPPPTVFEYVVRYADGQQRVIPVALGEQVTHWLMAEPSGLPGATLAWTGPASSEAGGDPAAVHSLKWTNPRPDVEVDTIEVRYNDEVGNRYGSPVVLGITAAMKTP